MTNLNPYVNFRGRAAEAMAHYHAVFGGDLTSSTFADFQMPGIDPQDAGLIMHSQLSTANGLVLMASDVPSSVELATDSFITISLSGDDETELRGYWDALADGGAVEMDLQQAPWGDHFGQLTDRFGVRWLVNIAGSGSGSGSGDGSGDGAAAPAGTGTAGDPAPEEI